MFDKNTVILSLEDYLDLIKENERLKDEVEYIEKDNYNLSMERIKLRKHILEKSENHTLYSDNEYELERLIDVEDWAFGLNYYKKLLELGFTMEELIDYIKERREFYEKEKRK